MTQYSCCQKAYMNGLHKGGMKAKEIAIQVDVPLGTVYRLIRAGYDPNDTTPFVETRGRNQQKYSAREKRWVVNFALKNKKATLDEIITGTRIDACRNTVRKMLKDQKLVRHFHVNEDLKWKLGDWKKVSGAEPMKSSQDH